MSAQTWPLVGREERSAHLHDPVLQECPCVCQGAKPPGTEPWHRQPRPRDAPAASWHAETVATASPFLPPAPEIAVPLLVFLFSLLHVIEKAMAVKLKTHKIFTKLQVFVADFQHLEN